VLKGRWVAQFLSALPLAVISLGAFVAVMPYSPRWLMSKGREEEAEGVLVRIYGRGSPVVAGEMEAIRRVIAEQGGPAAGTAGTVTPPPPAFPSSSSPTSCGVWPLASWGPSCSSGWA
jgi:hypothetical protein